VVINARVDVFLGPYSAGGGGAGIPDELVDDAVRRANAYLEAGADCVYPIAFWETGVARVSWALFVHRDAMARFKERLSSLAGEALTATSLIDAGELDKASAVDQHGIEPLGDADRTTRRFTGPRSSGPGAS
jgi:2-methylisocitrate lyase-like PEP mutase family enzyme